MKTNEAGNPVVEVAGETIACTKLVSSSSSPRWTYSVYRAALRLDGRTVALLSPDGRNAFGNGQIQPLLDALNKDEDSTVLFAKLNPPYERIGG